MTEFRDKLKDALRGKIENRDSKERVIVATATPITGGDPHLILSIAGQEAALTLAEAEQTAVEIMRSIGEVRSDTAFIKFLTMEPGLDLTQVMKTLEAVCRIRKQVFHPDATFEAEALEIDAKKSTERPS